MIVFISPFILPADAQVVALNWWKYRPSLATALHTALPTENGYQVLHWSTYICFWLVFGITVLSIPPLAS